MKYLSFVLEIDRESISARTERAVEKYLAARRFDEESLSPSLSLFFTLYHLSAVKGGTRGNLRAIARARART